MPSRRCAIKTIRVLAAATLKCLEPGKANTGALVQVRFTSHGPSNLRDGNETRKHCRCGGLHEQENCTRRFIACQGVYKLESQKTTTLGAQTSSRSLHSTASRGERTMQQVRDSSTRSLRVRTASDPIVVRAYQEVLRVATDMDPHEPALREVFEAFREAAEYNLPGGKRNRLLAVVHAYELLAEESAPHLELACVLGWCVEMLQSYFLILDDIMDGSPVRRGRPSWHTVPGVGLRAINDALFLEKAVLWVIRRRLGHLRCYLALSELFQESDLRTVLGQGLDMLSQKSTLEGFGADRYWAIVTYKAAFYSFVLPVRAGMLLAGVEDPGLHAQAQQAAVLLGRVFQVQDDYIDCFGDPEVTGKVGTDIVDGKCSWLAVQAVQRASPTQRSVLEANLGKGAAGGPEEAAVKAVYEELDLRGHYAAYEKAAFAELDSQLRNLPPSLAAVFRLMRDAIFGRDK
ncbi:unnamed protein product [Ixodes persulcatus]